MNFNNHKIKKIISSIIVIVFVLALIVPTILMAL